MMQYNEDWHESDTSDDENLEPNAHDVDYARVAAEFYLQEANTGNKHTAPSMADVAEVYNVSVSALKRYRRLRCDGTHFEDNSFDICFSCCVGVWP